MLSYAVTCLKFWHSVPLVTLKFSIKNYFKTKVLLKIFDAEFPYKLFFAY